MVVTIPCCDAAQPSRAMLQAFAGSSFTAEWSGWHTTPLAQQPLDEISRACQEETGKFMRGLPSVDDYGLELLRRAIVLREPRAWEAFFAQYHGMVLAWVRKHPAHATAGEEASYCVHRAFERFWSAVGPAHFQSFGSVAAALKYLKLCVNSVLLDEARARAASQMESLDALPVDRADAIADAEEEAIDRVSCADLWRAIEQKLADEAERAVVYGSFVLDMKPAEILHRHRDLLSSVADVYRIKRNVLQRLRRSPAILAFARGM